MNKNFLKSLGPGLLWAGAAVGVSHLVQSTRAGAIYGYELLWVVVLANVLKYPFFKFGPYYAAVTKKNLVQGYADISRWAVWLFFLMTLATMFIVQAAVTVVTTGLVNEVFGVELSPVQGGVLLLLLCLVLLLVGKYSLLDRAMKIIIVLLSVTTVVAVVFSFKSAHVGFEHTFSFSDINDVAFLIALMGWMPAPLDISVWHSMWTIEKEKQTTEKLSLKSSMQDFKTGYWGTMVLAVFFVILGANTMYAQGIIPENGATLFAKQLIGIYTQSIGGWAYYVIAVAALTTMFSTTLTCFDAYPRVMVPATEIVYNKKLNVQSTYWFWLIMLYGGTILMLWCCLQDMKQFIDFVTKVSFLVAPVLALLNYIVVFYKMPRESRPSKTMQGLSIAGIAYLLAFGVYYLWFI